MCAVARGEPIARIGGGFECRGRAGARTLRGSPCPIPPRLAAAGGRGQATADRDSEVLPRRVRQNESQKHVRGDRAKSRSRLSAGEPWKGQNPREQPAVAALITSAAVRDSGQGQSPGTAACRAGPSLRRREQRQDKRYVGPADAETRRQPSRRRKLRRVNPMSAAGVKQNRQGIDGRKPSRG
jgi:hypothetical protein